MKKFLIIGVLAVSAFILAVGYGSFGRGPAFQGVGYAVNPYGDEVILKGKVKKITNFYGKEVATIETDKGTVALIIPYKLQAYYDVNLKSGDEITVKGIEVTVSNETFVIPYEISIGGNNYTMEPVYRGSWIYGYHYAGWRWPRWHWWGWRRPRGYYGPCCCPCWP